MQTLGLHYYRTVNAIDVPVWRFDIGDREGLDTPAMREALALAGVNREQVDTFVEVLNGITHTIRPHMKFAHGFPIPA